MQLGTILRPDAVKTIASCTSKKRLFHDLGELAEASYGLHAGAVIDFDAVDRQPVDLVFALIAPENAGVEHLKALALVSRTLRNPAICSKLRANSDANTLHTILTEVHATQAA